MSSADTTTARAEQVRAIASDHAHRRGPLLPVLHAVQHEVGHISRPDVEVIADVLNLSVAEVHGVVSFYSDLRTEPAPRHAISLCRGEACQAVGAQQLYDDTYARFDVERDGVEVAGVFCLGNCALGPSGTVDGTLYGRLSADRLEALTARWSS